MHIFIEIMKIQNDDINNQTQIIQIGEQQIKRHMISTSRKYLKQYTCYQYTNVLKNQYAVVQSLQIQFKGNPTPLRNQIKYQIIDKLDPNGGEIMYICKWKNQLGNTVLDFFQFSKDTIRKIQMNLQPSYVNIVGQFMYIVGGAELYVVKIVGLTVVNVYALSNDIIHAVEPGFKQNDSNTKGVYVYALNSKHGFKKNFYSNLGIIQDNRWWNSLTNVLLLKKAPKQILNSTLKVVISNVLGILIMPNAEQGQKYSQICLINLSSMQPIAHCTLKLSNWSFSNPSKAIIKSYSNVRSKGFDDSLLISLGEKDKQMIQIIVFHIKYQPEIAQKFYNLKKDQNSLQVGLSAMTSGNGVDWNKSVVETYFCFSTEGHLIDYLLTEKGVIYYANTPSRIPISGFVNYLSPLNINPILALQHSLFSSYLADNDIFNKIQQLQKNQYEQNNQIGQQIMRYRKQLVNSILKPNRYSLNFIYTSFGISPLSQINLSAINPKQLLIDWYKLYKVRKIVKLQGDILLLRENSITTFLPIDQKQYYNQYQNSQTLLTNLQTFFQQQNRSSIGSYRLSMSNSQFVSPYMPIFDNQQIIQWNNQVNNINRIPFSYQKQGTINATQHLVQIPRQQQQKTSKSVQNYERHLQYFFSKIHKTFQDVQSPYQQQQIGLKSQKFARRLTINRIKDILCYNQKVLKYLFSITTNKHYTDKPIFKLQKILIKYLQFMYQLNNQAYEQVCAHGIDLVQIFINQEIQKSYQLIYQQRDNGMDQQSVNILVNVQKQSWKTIYNLLQQIVFVPNKQTHPVNSFLKLLLNNIKTGYKYLQQILNKVFNPYSTTNFYNNTPDTINFSHDQAYFPMNSTLLSIYSFLPLSDQMKNQIITSFLLRNFVSEGHEKAMNIMLAESISTKSFKDRVRDIYSQIGQIKNKPSILSQKSGKSQYNQSTDIQPKQIDNSLGIMYLSKVFEAEQLENYLIKQSNQQLQSIFRTNAQAVLNTKLQVKQQKYQKYTNQDILISWIFKYRIYVNKYKDLINKIDIFKQQDGSLNSSNLKKIAQKYIGICVNSLANIKQSYKNIYANKKNVRQNPYQPNFLNISEEELIEKVCCRMIGYDNSHSLCLYCKKDQKVLPTTSFFHIVYDILQDTQSFMETVSSLDSIGFYLLQKLLQNPDKNIQFLTYLSTYFSRSDLNKMLVQNGQLRQLYQQLGRDQNSQQIKSYFAYSEINNICISLNNWRASILPIDKNVASKTDKSLNKKAQIVQKSILLQDSKYENLVFRNAYLQTIGH